MIAHGDAGTFDFAFIDADKEGYWGYYERALTLVRAGGLIAIDNTLWSGRPADPDKNDATTNAIRAFNSRLSKDTRVRISLVPIGDGMTLALKIRD
jgi:caffeoyl-CoA O-methyltransferase